MRKSKIISLLLLLSLFYSCSKKPSCDQENVKELVFDIVKEKMKKEIINEYYQEHSKDIYDAQVYAKDKGLNVRKIVEEKETKIKNQAKIYATEQVEENVIFKLDGIRLLNIQEKLKKCECISELIIIDKLVGEKESLKITYSAQYTEDGKLYVEIVNINN